MNQFKFHFYRENAGSEYHNQLSRQLADWLPQILDKNGGMIALTDLYCFFNRARGTSLISPEDLHRACLLFEKLNLPVKLRRFDSGVLVVQYGKKFLFSILFLFFLKKIFNINSKFQ